MIHRNRLFQFSQYVKCRTSPFFSLSSQPVVPDQRADFSCFLRMLELIPMLADQEAQMCQGEVKGGKGVGGARPSK